MPEIAELNGSRVDDSVARLLRATSYAHFTSMQVRGGMVRGLDLHQRRLDRSSVEVFGHGLDHARVREYLHSAVTAAGGGDMSVRATALSLGSGEAPDVLVITSPPVEPGTTPVRLRSVEYERVLPHVKHTGTFGLGHHQRQAELAGYDDALFLDRDGHVSEASIWNICFVDGGTVVWPDAPALPGIMMQLIRAGLARLGVPVETRTIRLVDLSSYDAAFLTNSIDTALPVATIDSVGYPVGTAAAATINSAYESNPPVAI